MERILVIMSSDKGLKSWTRVESIKDQKGHHIYFEHDQLLGYI